MDSRVHISSKYEPINTDINTNIPAGIPNVSPTFIAPNTAISTLTLMVRQHTCSVAYEELVSDLEQSLC